MSNEFVRTNRNVEKPRKSQWTVSAKKCLQEDEENRLMKNLKEAAKSNKRRDVYRQIIFHLVLRSGLRCSEVKDLNWEDCALGNGQSSIEVVRGKGGKRAVVLIGPKLKANLRAFLRWRKTYENTEDIWGPVLLSTHKKRYTRYGIYELVKKVYADYGLPQRYHVHSLRHSFVSDLYRTTKDLRLCQIQARHSSSSVTEQYAHLNSIEIKNAMALLD